MALAINSFPVPVSPRTKTVESVGATRSTSARTNSREGLLPMISSNPFSAQPCSIDETLLTLSIKYPHRGFLKTTNGSILQAKYLRSFERLHNQVVSVPRFS